MRTRLLLAAVCMLALPLWFSTSPGDKLNNSAPFASVAYGGHTLGGDWCPYGSPGCIPDPGEGHGGNSAHRLTGEKKSPANQTAAVSAGSGFDFGTGTLMLALALFVWTRLRA